MVEVNERLYVSAEDFFTQIAESIAYDIKESTGKNIRTSQLHKGYSYTKTLKNKVGRQGNVKVTIAEFEYPKSYVAQFKSSTGVNMISYQIEVLDEDSIGVSYKESFEGDTKTHDANFKLVSFFYNRKAKKRAKNMLRSLEKYIKANGNQIGTEKRPHLQEDGEA